MASLCAASSRCNALRKTSGVRSAARVARVARVVRVAASADRPLWFPGNPPPAHLNGTLAGDTGFDPLNLASDPETLRWMVQAELVHSRWAMLGVAGILFTAIGAQAGLPFPQWYEAGKAVVAADNADAAVPFMPITGGKISFGTLLSTTFLLMGWVETKRWWDFKVPGSQADGSFLGFTEELKGKENGYPGGKWFDPFGLSRGTEEQYKKYKENEIKNGRLAMVAMLGFWSQYACTGVGPIANLSSHLADPYHNNASTNGVSVPFV